MSDAEVEAFIASLPDGRREIIERVDEVIRKAAPELEPAMWKGMIGYGNYRYKYASGREGEWFVVGLASNKRYVSMYFCAVVDGKYVVESNADRLGKVSCGKGCVRFTKLENLKLDVVSELVRTTADAVEADNFGM